MLHESASAKAETALLASLTDSDRPCALPTPDPWIGLETLVTRQNPDPEVTTTLNPSQRLEREQAVLAFTRNPAEAMGLGGVTQGPSGRGCRPISSWLTATSSPSRPRRSTTPVVRDFTHLAHRPDSPLSRLPAGDFTGIRDIALTETEALRHPTR